MRRFCVCMFVVGFLTFNLGIQLMAQAPAAGIDARNAARAAQLELEKNTPQLKVTEEVLPLSVPGHTIGETEGVSKNAQGHLFIYSRTGSVGIARGGAAAELFEFDQN